MQRYSLKHCFQQQNWKSPTRHTKGNQLNTVPTKKKDAATKKNNTIQYALI